MTSLSTKLLARHASGNPIRVGLIGAGKFGSMFLSQVHHTKGMHLVGIADLDPQRALESLKRVGFPFDRYEKDLKLQPSLAQVTGSGRSTITSNSEELIKEVDVVLECTGNPVAGIKHALLACKYKTHIVMVNVEADVLAGALLARKAKESGIIYSMAYGDQPAEIAELVDWARTAGFQVVCAGKGTKHLPEYHWSTPDTVWDYYGFTKEQLETGDFNPQMFNSFLDGTKSALEMAAVANGCNLTPPSNGLKFPPCGKEHLPETLKPESDGGVLEQDGMVEVASCLEPDGKNVTDDIRWGVFVVVKAGSDYTKECFAQYGLKTDSSGQYAVQYRPFHLIGLELGVSIASIALRGEPTGTTQTFSADVVAHLKRDLNVGEKLDGEGGFTVYGKLMPAKRSLQIQGLPIGLAHGMVMKVKRNKGEAICWSDVEYDASDSGVLFRQEMETIFRKEFQI